MSNIFRSFGLKCSVNLFAVVIRVRWQGMLQALQSTVMPSNVVEHAKLVS